MKFNPEGYKNNPAADKNVGVLKGAIEKAQEAKSINHEGLDPMGAPDSAERAEAFKAFDALIMGAPGSAERAEAFKAFDAMSSDAAAIMVSWYQRSDGLDPLVKSGIVAAAAKMKNNQQDLEEIAVPKDQDIIATDYEAPAKLTEWNKMLEVLDPVVKSEVVAFAAKIAQFATNSQQQRLERTTSSDGQAVVEMDSKRDIRGRLDRLDPQSRLQVVALTDNLALLTSKSSYQDENSKINNGLNKFNDKGGSKARI